MKLNILLAKTDALAFQFKSLIADYSRFFSKSQMAFRGERKTYTPREGTIDEPSKRGSIVIQTSVDEKIAYFVNVAKPYIDALFSQEKTNAMGIAKAELVVDGDSWGEFTSLELLRLKSVLENSQFTQMIGSIPVRSDAEEWVDTQDERYLDRVGDFKETVLVRGVTKTTEKTDYILKDPNVSVDSPNYTPVVAKKTTTKELGDYTHQRFSGEWSQRQRATALKRKASLQIAVIEALKTCNEVESEASSLTSEKIFGHIFGQ